MILSSQNVISDGAEDAIGTSNRVEMLISPVFKSNSNARINLV